MKNNIVGSTLYILQHITNHIYKYIFVQSRKILILWSDIVKKKKRFHLCPVWIPSDFKNLDKKNLEFQNPDFKNPDKKKS